HLGLPVSSYANIVLALHAYTHIYTIDHLAPQIVSSKSYPWGGYDQSYSLGEREARAMRAALFVSEFGSAPGDEGTLLKSQLAEQERHRTGFAFWPWKESSGASWGVFKPPETPGDSSGCLRVARERMLARVYPRLTDDPAATYHYDASDGHFTMHARGKAGDPSTVVYVPREVTGQITTDGAVSALVSDEPAGGQARRRHKVVRSQPGPQRRQPHRRPGRACRGNRPERLRQDDPPPPRPRAAAP